jgi:hypothetical protein
MEEEFRRYFELNGKDLSGFFLAGKILMGRAKPDRSLFRVNRILKLF